MRERLTRVVFHFDKLISLQVQKYIILTPPKKDNLTLTTCKYIYI